MDSFSLLMDRFARAELYTFGGQKSENRPPEPTNEFGAQNQYVRVIYPSIGIFEWSKKIHTIGGQNGANRPLEPNNEIYICDISIDREFYME
jgi:hypothetical protein